jgi:hypothetical protein
MDLPPSLEERMKTVEMVEEQQKVELAKIRADADRVQQGLLREERRLLLVLAHLVAQLVDQLSLGLEARLYPFVEGVRNLSCDLERQKHRDLHLEQHHLEERR